MSSPDAISDCDTLSVVHISISFDDSKCCPPSFLGNIMDCHDGNIMRWPRTAINSAGLTSTLEDASTESLFYFFCMAYGPCHNTGCASNECGGRLDHNISLYTSPNLTSGSWMYVSDLLPMSSRPNGTYYRPKVIFNAQSNQYILWVNWMPQGQFSESAYLTASSPHPAGPYTISTKSVATKYAAGGDFSLFVDDDAGNTAYVVYTSLASGHSISIEPLAADYLSSVATENSGFLPGTTGGCYEAPAMFKRNGTYWVLLGPCSCFGASGSDTFVYNASHPLGPYTRVGSLGDREKAQQNYIFEVSRLQYCFGAWPYGMC